MISIIVPVYNVEPYLNRCLDSILHQSYRDVEIILVDDGSTDASPSICDEYARLDNRVKVIHQENGGLSFARNVGLDYASGEYIAFIDGDDYILPSMYERMLETMKTTDAELVMCSYLNIREDNSYMDVANIQRWSGSGMEFMQTDGIVCNYVWNKLYHRKLFSGTRFPVGKTFEDIFVMHDIFAEAKKVSIIPDVLYVYQQREDGISKNLLSYHRMDFLRALVERLRFLLQVGAGERAVVYHIGQIYTVWKRYYDADMIRDERIAECWKNCYAEFCLITRGISNGWHMRNKLELWLFRRHPQLLRLAYGM